MNRLHRAMIPLKRLLPAAAFLILMSAMTGCARTEGVAGDDPSVGAADYERGPEGGRLLRSGDFAVEIKIFEDGVPPEFHIYGYERGRRLDPQTFRAQVELTRLGGKPDRFEFHPAGDFLRGAGIVHEPHSFDVRVTATRDSQRAEWSYASYEGRTQIQSEIAQAAQIVSEAAGPAVIREQIELSGVIRARTDRVAEIRARFPGVVRELRKSVGDSVAAGEAVARIQSNESLEEYTAASPLGGIVLTRDARWGEVAGTAPLMVVADLTSVWADLDAFAKHLPRLKSGQRVEIEDLDGLVSAQGTISRIDPQALHASQSVKARVTLENPAGRWRPGQFVRAAVTVNETNVPLAVRTSALQGFRDFTVVFAQVGDVYEVRMLEVGRRDDEWVEVLDGLEPGERYVVENSFLVKADIEKSGASHDH